MSSPGWLSRYRDGQRKQVWHELRQPDRTVLDSGLAEEAQLVCDEMALRARHNIEVIVDRLSKAGYRFHVNDDGQKPVVPFIPATAGAGEYASWLREQFDAVPMTLLSWVRLVGDVWLVGTHPGWPESSSGDPLVIQVEGSHYPESSIRELFKDELEIWSERKSEDPETGPFVLPLAPDRLHKENVSGGEPYGVILPDGCVDGLFVAETTMPFVSYLNRVFRNGGFPWHTGSEAQSRVCRALREDMLPL